MGKILIKPKKLEGIIEIPPSKSLSHRAIICAALCERGSKCVVDNIILSDDINATIKGLSNLGVKISSTKERDDRYKLYIKREINSLAFANINCNESGSTLRFLIPISLLYTNFSIFEGYGRLSKRPLDVYYKIFDEKNIKYTNKDGGLPLRISGNLKSGIYTVKGNISSQFITGLMFTLPLLDGDSKIIIEDKLESKGYVNLTISILKKFGIKIINNDYKEFLIYGKQIYRSIDYNVESDFSQGAFYIVANELGCNIDIKGLNKDSIQGDKKILRIIDDIKMQKPNFYSLDASEIPDLVPILTVYFSLQEGIVTHIINSKRLRYKESDRLNAISTQLNKLGADIEELEDGLIIKGKKDFNGGVSVSSFNDHRIAMALAIAAIKCKSDIELEGFESVKKSYPRFFNDYKSLGGDIYELDLGK